MNSTIYLYLATAVMGLSFVGGVVIAVIVLVKNRKSFASNVHQMAGEDSPSSEPAPAAPVAKFPFNRWSVGMTFVLLISLLPGAYAFHLRQILRYPQKMLTVDSGDVQGDVAIVLGGSADRPQRAALLYREGSVRAIIVTGRGDTDINATILEQMGVPAAAIIKEPLAKNTFENASFSLKIAEKLGYNRVIVVTSWYHSRRAMMCFEQLAPKGMTFYSRPSYLGYSDQEANQHLVTSFARLECLKLLLYRLRYGISAS